jgi:hypothetical protein
MRTTRGRARRHLRPHSVKTRIPPVHRQPLHPEMGTCNYLSHVTAKAKTSDLTVGSWHWPGQHFFGQQTVGE